MTLFILHNQTEHANILSNYLPGGEVFGGKSDNDSNLHKLLFGIAEQYRLVEEKIELTCREYDPITTVDFLKEWESALGIPDECFDAKGTVTERRRDVNVKFLADTAVTNQDFVDIAALYGITVTIKSGLSDLDAFPLQFPITFPNIKTARFTMIVEFTVDDPLRFTFTFPIPFGEANIETLKCLFRKLAPANVDVIFREI